MRTAALLIVLSLTLFVGCSSSLETVTVPAPEPSLNANTDTTRVEQLPPVPPPGLGTQPVGVTIFDDTAQGPTLAVRRVTVDRRPDRAGVSVQYEAGATTRLNRYNMPAYGEALDIRPQKQTARTRGRGRPGRAPGDTIARRDTIEADTADQDLSLGVPVLPTAQLRGNPEPQEMQAEVQEDPRSWWQRQWDRAVNLLAGVGAIALLFGVGGLALRATRFSLPI